MSASNQVDVVVRALMNRDHVRLVVIEQLVGIEIDIDVNSVDVSQILGACRDIAVCRAGFLFAFRSYIRLLL